MEKENPRRTQKGQASIMLGLMMLTFIFFFCFVINVGMLVNAKINLQNAADLAAYAGAATQARQLTHISYLNYEMRRQYKKFLFRYYVIGNQSEKAFPTQASGQGSTPPLWSPTGSPTPVNYQVPVVCLIFNQNDNYCQISDLPAIPIPPPTGFDAISDALGQQLQQLEQIKGAECDKIGNTNQFALILWLWNADPSASNTDQVFATTDITGQILPIIQGVVQGLGLVPKELILRQRIDTLMRYVNDPPQTDVGLSTVDTLMHAADPSHHERTIQAYMSAFNTLGNHTFSGIVQMDELQSANQLQLNNIQTNFDSYAVVWSKIPVGQNGSLECEPMLVPATLQDSFTVGVFKDPTVLTYYAVRLTATAQLMFNPWGNGAGLTLKAYSAAQPFGSRIGPDDKTALWRGSASPGVTVVGGSSNLVGYIPNLPISTGDTADAGKGWDTDEALGTFHAAGLPNSVVNQGVGGQLLTTSDFEQAYQVAMAPNPWETKYYNIPNNLSPPSSSVFLQNIFDPQGALQIWAPLVSAEDGTDVTTALQNDLVNLFRNNLSQAGGLVNSLKTQLSNYVMQLQSGTPGDDCETFNTVRLRDPFHYSMIANCDPVVNSVGGQIALTPWITPTDPTVVSTSWNAPNDPVTPGSPGRVGYSVKFISFDSLINNKIITDNQGTSPTNTAPVDEAYKIDSFYIQH